MKHRARLGYIAAADAVLLLVGVIGIFAVGPSDDAPTTPVAAFDATATITPATTAAPTTVAPASATTVKGKKGATVTTAAPGPAGGAAGASPGGSRPPKDGTYRTKVHSESDMMEKKSNDSELSSTYKTVKSTPAETEQTVTRKSSGGSGGEVSTSSMYWRPGGVYTKTNSSGGGGSSGNATCTPAEQMVLKLPLTTGVTWTNTIDCKVNGPDGSTMTTHIETISKVLGSKQAQVAGRSVQVWEITSTSKTDTTASGQNVKGSGDGKQLFAPDHGLFVHEEQTQKGSSKGFSYSFTSVSDLLNLDPA